MSQYLLPVIDPSINTGSQLSVWLNLWAEAVQSGQKGASRPVDSPAGMIWIKDVSPVLQQLMVFEGVDDLVLIEWNPSTNVVTYPGAVKGPGSSNIYNLASWGGDNGNELLDTGFEIQSSVTDAVGNKVMRVGAFGLGTVGTSVLYVGSLDDPTVPTGMYRVDASVDGNWPASKFGGTLITARLGATSISQMLNNPATNVTYLRGINVGVAGPWVELWTSANLVKQANPTDTTIGRMMAVGAWGWGASRNINLADANVWAGQGLYNIPSGSLNEPPNNGGGAGCLCIGDTDFGIQVAFSYGGQAYIRISSATVWGAWKQFAFTSGSTFLGETQFDSIKATGTIKSDGGQVSAADMEAFTATQLNEAGQPLPPTFLIDLENQVTALQAQITALQAQVEALTP